MKPFALVAISTLALASPLAHAAYSFGAYQSYAIGGGAMPGALAVGDVDGDGRKDVVITTGYAQDPAKQSKVLIYLQKADGTLATPRVVPYLSSNSLNIGGVAIGDLNGDRRNEIIVGHDTGISIVRWNLAATKATLVRVNVGIDMPNAAMQVALLDVDRDGRMDVVGQADEAGVVIYYGDGTGGIKRQKYLYDAGGMGSDLEVGDFNGDGYTDLATQSAIMDSTGVLFPNDGTDDFGPPRGVGNGGSSTDFSQGAALGVGDFNHDGKIDLANRQPGQQVVTLYAQNGLPYGYVNGMMDINGLVGADMDGDGRDDLVVLREGTAFSLVLQGNTGMQAPVDIVTPAPVLAPRRPNHFGLDVGDVNGDGCKDVVITTTTGFVVHPGVGCAKPDVAPSIGLTSKTVALRIDNFGDAAAANVDALLALSVDEGGLIVGDLPSGCAIEDTTERSATVRCTDGSLAARTSKTRILPIYVTGGSVRNYLRATTQVTTTTTESRTDNNTVRRTLANPKPVPVEDAPVPGTAFSIGAFYTLPFDDYDDADSVAIADVDADGRKDLIVATTNGRWGRYEIRVYRQDDTGTLLQPLKIAYGDYATHTGLVVTDLDGDAYPDIVVGGSNVLAVVEWKSDLQALDKTTYSRSGHPAPEHLVALDVNHDGNTDVVTLECCFSNTMAVYFGNGAGSFSGAQDIASPQIGPFSDLATGDFNHDGRGDVALISGMMAAPYVYYGGPTGLLPATALAAGATPDNNRGWVAAGDVNSDGIDDLVATHGRHAVSVYLGPTMALQAPLATDWDPTALAVDDMDQDGRDDLVAIHGILSLGLYKQTNAGTLSDESLFPGDPWSVLGNERIATGDLNGDGCPDTAYARTSAGVAIYPSRGCPGAADLAVGADLTSTQLLVRVENAGDRGVRRVQLDIELRASMGSFSPIAVPTDCVALASTSRRLLARCTLQVLSGGEMRTFRFDFTTSGMDRRGTLAANAVARSDAKETLVTNNRVARILRTATTPTFVPQVFPLVKPAQPAFRAAPDLAPHKQLAPVNKRR